MLHLNHHSITAGVSLALFAEAAITACRQGGLFLRVNHLARDP